MQIISSFPTWFYLLCLLAGLVTASILYFRYRREGLSQFLIVLLFALRTVSVSLIAFLILNPFIRTDKRIVEDPTILIAIDNSSSVILNRDSNEYRDQLPTRIESLTEEFEQLADVRALSFGSEVSDSLKFTFDEKTSDFQSFFRSVEDRFSNSNVAAIVLVSDGIYNVGVDPVLASSGLRIPVYTLALGDTSSQRDVILHSLRANTYAYLGNKFPLEAEFEANGYEGSEVFFELREFSSEGSKLLKTERRVIGKENVFEKLSFIVEAKTAGLKRYRLSARPLGGEISLQNNQKEIFIEVLDTKRKVAILAAAPHPDVKALRRALENNGNTEVEVYYGREADRKVMDFDLAILHQLPSLNGHGKTLLPALEKDKKPYWLIAGSMTDYNLMSSQQSMMDIRQKNRSQNKVQPALDRSFKLFQLDPIFTNRLQDLPPLNAPFGNYSPSIGLYSVLNQKIGSVSSDYCLHGVYEGTGKRMALTMAEGLWQWALSEYETYKDNRGFEEFVTKTIQFLGARRDKRSFKVLLEKNIFDENERIEFSAELYDASYQAFNEPDVQLKVEDEEGKEYSFNFNRSGKRYFLNAGRLPAGSYTYYSYTTLGGKRLSSRGSFVVRSLDIESLITRADHQMLRRLAEESGGKSYNLKDIDQLARELQDSPRMKPVSYLKTSVEELINWKWLLALATMLLATEWFIRKFTGGY